ncbi:MAG: GtrA family protein [Oscillospiraceae bacterium]|nr:GtrA family protein [Oscillospiraceae bacterium]
MQTIRKLWNKLMKDPEIWRYLIVGALVTALNYGVFGLCFLSLGLDKLASNAIAWVVAVIVAYVANKAYVFRSKTHSLKETMGEMASFVAMRLISLGLESVLLLLLVDVLHIHEMISKIITNVVVVVSNYAFSKLFIFADKTHRKGKSI